MNNQGHFSGLVVMGYALVCLAFPASSQSTINNQQSTIPFDRYQVILARMPFGDEAAAAAAAAAAAQAATAQQQQADSFTKTLKLCAITKNHFNNKIQVGLVDSATKKSYFLYQGDQEDGIELVSADYEGEKALLRKGAEEAWLDMNAAPVIVSAVSARPVGLAPGARVMRRGMATPPPEPLKPLYTGAALEEHLKNYQMELIRAKGEKGPPLPLELTPEMDDQLVKEGVLPPAE
jgi:hypothetical protein